MDFNENDSIGNYRLLKLCGTGSYGKVFLAKNQLTGHFVALKIITDNGKIMERELRGLINYRNCRHENLLQIHHIDKIDGMLYYTMDAADNINNSIENYQPNTLGYRLDRIDRMYPAAVKKMGSELLAGIQKLHSFGIIHRDIKPDNILWINGKAVLGDIGLIAEKQNSTLAGTPEFMSQDLLARKRSANESDDLFSLSRVLYCAFTGSTPDRFPQLPPGLLKETGAIDTWKFILSIYRNVPPVKSDTNSSTDYTDRKRKKLQIILLIITILSFLLALPTAFISLILSPAVSPFVLDAILLIFIVTLFWNISLIRSTALKILFWLLCGIIRFICILSSLRNFRGRTKLFCQ